MKKSDLSKKIIMSLVLGNMLIMPEVMAGSYYGKQNPVGDGNQYTEKIGQAGATNRTLRIANGTYKKPIVGSNNFYGTFAAAGDVTNGTAIISGGTITGDIYGGYTLAGSANSNVVTVSGGSINGTIYGGCSSTSGHAVGNVVNISGGNINGTIYGGWSNNNTTDTSVIISGGTFGENSKIIAARSENNDAQKVFNNNSITIEGMNSLDLSKAILMGFESNNGRAKGATLNVKRIVAVKSVQNFGTFNITLPSGTTKNDTILSVTNAVSFGGVTVNVYLGGYKGTDTITLINSVEGVTADDVKKYGVYTGVSGSDTASDYIISLGTGDNAGKLLLKYDVTKVVWYTVEGDITGKGEFKDNADQQNISETSNVIIKRGTNYVEGKWALNQYGTIDIGSNTLTIDLNTTTKEMTVTGELKAGSTVISTDNTLFIDPDNLKSAVVNNGTVTLNADGILATGSTITGGTLKIDGTIYSNAGNIGAATNVTKGNTLTLTGDTDKDPAVLGGKVTGEGTLSFFGNVASNASYLGAGTVRVAGGNTTLTLNSGTLDKVIYGGYHPDGYATGTTINVIDVTVNSIIYGGYATAGDVTGNKVTVSGNSTVNANIYGGYAQGTHGTLVANDVSSNTVTISDGNINGDVYGGWSELGDATKNIVTIDGGSIVGDIYGGYADATLSHDSSENKVIIAGGTIGSSKVYGGYARSTGVAEKNEVIISGGIFGTSGKKVDIYAARGGSSNFSGNSVTINGSNTLDLTYANLWGYDEYGKASGATLNVERKDVSVNAVKNFGTINFDLNGIAAKSIMLSADNTVKLDGVTVSVKNSSLSGDSYITLIKNVDDDRFNPGANYKVLNFSDYVDETTKDLIYYSGTAPVEEKYFTIKQSGITGIKEWSQTVRRESFDFDIQGNTNVGVLSQISYSGNEITFHKGTYTGDVYGAKSSSSSVTGNTVTINGGTFSGSIYGGYASGKTVELINHKATDNKVVIAGGIINGIVYGGYSEDGGASTNEVIIREGATINGTIYGGCTNGVAGRELYQNKVTIDSGTFNNASIYGYGNKQGLEVDHGSQNTLNVNTKVDGTIKTIGNFDIINFTLSDAVKVGNTVLSVENAVSLSGVAVNVYLGGFSIDEGKTITLISNVSNAGTYKVYNGTSDSHTDNLQYTISVSDNKLILTNAGELWYTIGEIPVKFADGVAAQDIGARGKAVTGDVVLYRGANPNNAYGLINVDGTLTVGTGTGKNFTVTGDLSATGGVTVFEKDTLTIDADNLKSAVTVNEGGTLALTSAGLFGHTLSKEVSGEGTVRIDGTIYSVADNIRAKTNVTEDNSLTLTSELLTSATLNGAVSGKGTLNIAGTVYADADYIGANKNVILGTGTLVLTSDVDGLSKRRREPIDTVRGAITGNGTLYINGVVTSNADYLGADTIRVVSEKTLNLVDGILSKNIYGGYSTTGDATGTTINVKGVTVNSIIYGGYNNDSLTNQNTTWNTVKIRNSTVTKDIYGGYSGHHDAKDNIVTISGRKTAITGSNIYGGYAAAETGTDLSDNNEVNIKGGTISTSNIYGGYSKNGSASGNKVTVSWGANISESIIYGGYNGKDLVVVTEHKDLKNNIVTINGGKFNNVSIHGVGYQNTNNKTISGNTLNVNAQVSGITTVDNFQIMNFTLPGRRQLDKDIPMLSVGNAIELDNVVVNDSDVTNKNMAVNVYLNGYRSEDTITLIDKVDGTETAELYKVYTGSGTSAELTDDYAVIVRDGTMTLRRTYLWYTIDGDPDIKKKFIDDEEVQNIDADADVTIYRGTKYVDGKYALNQYGTINIGSNTLTIDLTTRKKEMTVTGDLEAGKVVVKRNNTVLIDADNLKSTVTVKRNGALTLTGDGKDADGETTGAIDTLQETVTGDGTLNIAGDIFANANNIGAKTNVTKGNTLTLTDGKLTKTISGKGNVTIGDGKTDATVKSTFANFTNSGNLTVSFGGTLETSGNINKDVLGTDGTVKLIGATKLSDGNKIDGTLDGNRQKVNLVSWGKQTSIDTFNVGTLNGKIYLSLDVDMSKFTSDQLDVGIFNGNVVVTGINITKGITNDPLELPKEEKNKIVYLTKDSGEGTTEVRNSTITVTNKYQYTFTAGETGKLNYKVEAIDLTFKKFMEGTLSDGKKDPATLSLTDDLVNKGKGSTRIIVGDEQSNREITVNLNGHKLISEKPSTVAIKWGKTLNLDGGSEDTAGVVDANTKFSVSFGAKMNISGNITVNGVLDGEGKYTNKGTLTIVDAANLQMSNGLKNKGIVTLNAGTLSQKITGDGWTYISTTGDKIVTIAADVSHLKNEGNMKVSGTPVTFKDAVFAAGSTLTLNADQCVTAAPINITDTITVADGAKLRINGVVKNQVYSILNGVTGTADDYWNKEDIEGKGFRVADIKIEGNVYQITFSNDVPEGTMMKNILTYADSDSDVVKWAEDITHKHGDDVLATNEINALAAMGENLGVTRGALDSIRLVGATITDHLYDKPLVPKAKAGLRNVDYYGRDDGELNITEIPVAKANEVMPKRAEKAKHNSGDAWARFTHNRVKVDGLYTGDMKAQYSAQYNGVSVGYDLVDDQDITMGVALHYADGNATNGFGGHNDSTYTGISIYAQKLMNEIVVSGDMTYLHGKNEMDQAGVTANAKTNTVSVGFDARRPIKVGKGYVTPFTGMRYNHVENSSYTDSLGINRSSSNVSNFVTPLGVRYGVTIEKFYGWTVQPFAEIGYLFNYGDKGSDMKLRYGTAEDTFGFNAVDRNTFFTRAGMNFGKKNITAGVGYDYMKSSNSNNNKWNINCTWSF